MIKLGVCRDCAATQYPPREVCGSCLSQAVELREVDAQGTLLACTRIHRSIEPRFASRLPLDVGSVKLDAGPVAIAFVPAGVAAPGARVRLEAREEDGRTVLVVA